MRLTIASSKIKKGNLVLINNATYQRETLSERPIPHPLSIIGWWFSCFRMTNREFAIYSCTPEQHKIHSKSLFCDNPTIEPYCILLPLPHITRKSQTLYCFSTARYICIWASETFQLTFQIHIWFWLYDVIPRDFEKQILPKIYRRLILLSARLLSKGRSITTSRSWFVGGHRSWCGPCIDLCIRHWRKNMNVRYFFESQTDLECVYLLNMTVRAICAFKFKFFYKIHKICKCTWRHVRRRLISNDCISRK